MWRATGLSRPTSLLLLVLWPAVTAGSTLFDPALRFFTFRTDHFVIYFHRGEEELARRLAEVAEDAWQELTRSLRLPPPALTHVVLADQSDSANGWATPLPYNTIVVTAAAPSGAEFIGRTSEWLRLVFTHEFAHIVHLDQSRGWAQWVRLVFGRMPLAFPNLLLPAWQIEGLATHQESLVPGEGRLHAGAFRAVEREAARSRDVEPIDRVNGGLTDWPGGTAPYAYGLGFHQYLAERYGAETIGTLARDNAGSAPFLASRAFRRVFGRSLGSLWDDYRRHLESTISSSTESEPAPTRLTQDGFTVLGPRFVPPPCPTCPSEIVYSRRTPQGFPSLYSLAPDRPPRALTTRYLGSTSGVGRSVVVFDQQEIHRNAGFYSDLFLLDRTSGDVRALTSGARLMDPDLSPDGETIVCVREGSGRRDLVLVRLTPQSDEDRPVEVLVSEPATQFSAPRWSPDGRMVAVERKRPGAQSEIAIVDVGSRALSVVTSNPETRFVTPAWRRDGRAVVVAADFHEAPFNLYELTLDGRKAIRQLTFTTGGAMWPDVSTDGRTLVFVGYTADGFDLFTLPYPIAPVEPSTGVPPAHPASLPAVGTGRAPRGPSGTITRYAPWPTLKPTSWTPVVGAADNQVRVGAAIEGTDVLGYHAYGASVTWLAATPSDVDGIDRMAPDWELSYVYDRWRPTLFASASRATDFFPGRLTDGGATRTVAVREQQVEAGMLLPVRHVRVVHRALFSALHSSARYTPVDGAGAAARTAVRFGWATSSARRYGYSVSQEHGVAVGATAELARSTIAGAGVDTTVTADVRGYAPTPLAHHVFAIRAAGGWTNAADAIGRRFILGGSGPAGDVMSFDREAFSMLRGFGSARVAGSRIAVMNLDYRWPIARPQRGVGTWPGFLHTVHGAVFLDAGHAWTRAFRRADVKSAVGAELSVDIVAGYGLPLTLTVGAARTRGGREGNRAVYARVGRPF